MKTLDTIPLKWQLPALPAENLPKAYGIPISKLWDSPLRIFRDSKIKIPQSKISTPVIFFLGATVNGFVNVSISTLEQRFGFDSWMTGLMAVSYDIGFVLVSFYVSFVLVKKRLWTLLSYELYFSRIYSVGLSNRTIFPV